MVVRASRTPLRTTPGLAWAAGVLDQSRGLFYVRLRDWGLTGRPSSRRARGVECEARVRARVSKAVGDELIRLWPGTRWKALTDGELDSWGAATAAEQRAQRIDDAARLGWWWVPARIQLEVVHELLTLLTNPAHIARGRDVLGFRLVQRARKLGMIGRGGGGVKVPRHVYRELIARVAARVAARRGRVARAAQAAQSMAMAGDDVPLPLPLQNERDEREREHAS